MGFSFGEKKSEVKESDGIYLRNFKKGDTKVRFLEEPGDWYAYREHFDPGINKSFPCMGSDYRDVCPGCTSDNERVRNAPRRYGTFLYLVDQKRVIPFKIPQRLSERLSTRAERNNGTLLTRDYVIIKSGTGLDTEYDVDQDERYDVDTKALMKDAGDLSAEDIVSKMFVEAFGDPEEFLANNLLKKDKKPDLKVVDDDTPPWEVEKKAEKSDDVEVSEESLMDMSRSELEAIWEKAGFGEINDDWGKKDLVSEILKRADS